MSYPAPYVHFFAILVGFNSFGEVQEDGYQSPF